MNKPKPIFSVRNRLLEVVIQEAPHWPERIARKLADSLALNLATDLLIDSGVPESSLPPAFHILLVEDSVTVERVVRRVAAEVGRRFYTTSLGNFSQAGLVGMSPSDLAADLYVNAGRDRRAAQHSIVLLKSLESILSKDRQDDVGGVVVQRQFTDVLRGCALSFGRPGSEDRTSLGSSRMTFIVTGEMPGLREALQRRQCGGYDIDEGSELPTEACVHISVDDLAACRLEAAFVRCFAVRCLLAPAGIDTFAGLLAKSAMPQVTALIKAIHDAMGIDVTIDDKADQELAKTVMAKEGDASGVQPVVWDIVARALGEEVAQIRIDGTAAKGDTAPWAIPGDTPGNPALDGLLAATAQAGPSSTASTAMTDQEMLAKAREISRVDLGYADCVGTARAWWDEVLTGKDLEPRTVLKLCQEMHKRTVRINEVHLAHVRADARESIAAVLAYAEYMSLKNKTPSNDGNRGPAVTEGEPGATARPSVPTNAEVAAPQPDGRADGTTVTLRSQLETLCARVEKLRDSERIARQVGADILGSVRVIRQWRYVEASLRKALRAMHPPQADVPGELGDPRALFRYLTAAWTAASQLSEVLEARRTGPYVLRLHDKAARRLAWIHRRLRNICPF